MTGPFYRPRKQSQSALYPILFIIFSITLQAQTPEWKPVVNFEDRDVLFLFDNGQELFAGIAGLGLLISSDEGETWQEIPIDQQAGYPTSLSKDQEVYHLTSLGGGIYESKDGKTFSNISTGLPVFALWAAAAGEELYVAGSQGVYSRDAQGHWQEELPEEIYQREVLFDVVARSGLVVAGGRRNVYLKDPKSGLWQVADFDFKFDIRNIYIFNDQTIWVGTNGDGAYVSVDQGQSWSPVNREKLNDNVIFFSRSEPEKLVTISSDGLYKPDVELNEGTIVPSFKNIVLHKNAYYSGTTSMGIWKFGSSGEALIIPTGDKSAAPDHQVNLRMYPNPTNGKLAAVLSQNFIVEGGDDFQLQFFDLTGRLIKRIEMPNGSRVWQEDLVLEVVPGIYRYDLIQERKLVLSGRLIVSK